ncbi:hypothetical protein FNH07_22535 [Amycolatopsis bartoniae]|uniref:putative leader peptide n=1 Tax=Amycolatopsis bartoniae TaxID=941986 RepID=UPI0011974961|nr:hypothetical protein FNH07_22535 [Amycolatopsis bartoniae]
MDVDAEHPSSVPHVNPRDDPPSIRTLLDHTLGTWHAENVTSAGVLLVARRHVDLRRVASALCRPSC